MKKSFIVIIILAVAAAVFYGVRYVKSPVDTQAAFLTTYEDKISAKAYIVKDEEVYRAETAGTVYSYEAENSRVGKSRKIATVYTASTNTDMLQELNNIDKKIAQLESQKSEEFVSDSTSVESQIEERKKAVIDAVYSRDISKINEYKTDIKNLRSGNYKQDNQSSELTELQNQKKSLETSIGNSKKDIYSSRSGIYTTGVDGMESVLTPSTAGQYTVSQFEALKDPGVVPAKTSVVSGDSVCKVVNNMKWYAMLLSDAQKLSGYKVGDSVGLKFDAMPGVEVSASIYAISPEEDGKVVLTVECTKYVEGIYSARTSELDVVLKSYTGYRVPVYAIKVQNNEKGVMVKSNNNQIFKKCEILYTNDAEGFSIIASPEDAQNPISEMDQILLGHE